MKGLSRKELVERLRAIAEDDTPRVEHCGAMCYSPSLIDFDRKIRLKCDCCGANIDVHDDEEYKNIFSLVRNIKSLGYDAKVEMICEDCAKKFCENNSITIKNSYRDDFDLKKDARLYSLNYLFYFRLSDDADYHCVIDNDSYHYKSLLTFLENEDMYLGDYDESHYLADEIDVIEFMTGLKLNE